MVKQEQVVHIGAPDERERKRRRFEILAALTLLILVMGGTWTQLTLYGVDSWMFIALLNINSIFMLVILFLVARNVVKLIMERRRKVFGAQIRTRLVVVFVSLSLIPTVIMFLASNRVVATSVDYWFTRQMESSLQAALDVGQSFYAASAERLHARSEAIVQEVESKKMIWGSSAFKTLLQNEQMDYGLTLVGIVDPQGQEIYWQAPENFTAGWKEARSRINWGHVASTGFGSLLWATDSADYVIGVQSLDGGKKGYLVTSESIGQGLLAKLEKISKGFEEYAQLKQLKKPLKVSFLLILGVLGMITIFGSIWFGFKLSKEFTEPILALAQGTIRIAQGDLDFRLEDKGNDELSQLVESFNHMAKDLEEGSARLTKANVMLAEHNRYIETVLDNITTGVITLDGDGRIQTMNKAACTIFEARSTTFEGRNPVDFLPRNASSAFSLMLETLRLHPEQTWKKQEDFILGDRSWKLVLHAVALSGPGGIKAYVVVVEDITELEKMQRMAAWREVARRIAHEIKNPLTPIKLSAQRLDKKFGKQIDDPAFGQCTDLIVKQVERLQDMVQEFSSFAKLPEVQLVPGAVAPLLDELVFLFRNSHTSINWELHLPEALPLIALDAGAMHRALLNILTNAAEALEAMPDDSVRKVRIIAVHDQGRGSLRFVISDNGPGLSPDERERMFEPYFSRKKGGTGLGLAIVKSIVADHRGTIRAVGVEGGGTSIVLEFPVFLD